MPLSLPHLNQAVSLSAKLILKGENNAFKRRINFIEISMLVPVTITI